MKEKKEVALSPDEQRTLKLISSMPRIQRSNLTRRMHGMGIKTETVQQEVLDSLQITHKLIDSVYEGFTLSKSGRKAQFFSVTVAGKRKIIDLLRD